MTLLFRPWDTFFYCCYIGTLDPCRGEMENNLARRKGKKGEGHLGGVGGVGCVVGVGEGGNGKWLDKGLGMGESMISCSLKAAFWILLRSTQYQYPKFLAKNSDFRPIQCEKTSKKFDLKKL